MILLDKEFYVRLEYAITNALIRSSDADWRRCWCDGILPTEDHSSTLILETKKVVTKAWIDEGRLKGKQRGQFLYDMQLNLGSASIDKLKAGSRFEECIPTSEANSWIVLDRENKIIEVLLL